MKNKMWIKRVWIVVLIVSALLLQFKIPSGMALAQNSEQKVVKKKKGVKLPGRLGLGFGPFYSNYVVEKGLKK